jgi:uncharacterized protein YeaO (DUF488 family)
MRVLVTRYYPRGIPSSGKTWHAWVRELAPSRELHKAIKEGRIGWDEYDRRFLAEMEGEPAQRALQDLADRAAAGETVTLLCDHPPALAPERCHRFLVARLLEERVRRLRPGRA